MRKETGNILFIYLQKGSNIDPDGQQLKKPYVNKVFLIAARSEVSAYLTPWTRNAFPCESTRERKSCTKPVRSEKRTRGPGLAAIFKLHVIINL